MNIIRTITLSLLTFLFAQPALAENKFSLGVEGFYDRYQEPDPVSPVTDNTPYGSITGSYEYDAASFFTAVDGRVSYGTDHYSSVTDGTSSGSPQYEGEFRWRVGETISSGSDFQFSPYVGIGNRLFYDHSKGSVTSLGSLGYDRRILQFYVPVGMTWQFGMGEWIVKPTAEYDQLVWGHVNARLQNTPGGFNVSNTQTSGYGLRGDLMLRPSARSSWEAGPFFRYWNIADSNTYTAPDLSQWDEPPNTRLQVGVAARLLF